MASGHVRASSGDAAESRAAKKSKTTHAFDADPSLHFASGLLAVESVQRLHKSYAESEPYKHAFVEKLFDEELLTKVKDEIIGELSFTEKETDIYKVHQTGDLASLSYLDESQLALLPNLLVLRNALYSAAFRSFVRKVTGCGPLSGLKMDMSVNSYKEGCHLLNHDDVIGTRRVSYILYMPLPMGEEWKREYGGALELYPVKPGVGGTPEPECFPSKIIPPSWNQFIFFEVQPGHSFHSVEEVIVDEGKDGRQRLSISGWFHKAQTGEEGYEGEEVPATKSSLEQLTSTTTTFTPYSTESSDGPDSELPEKDLSPEHVKFLEQYLNPTYVQPRSLAALRAQFVDESSLELWNFLKEDLADMLDVGLREQDEQDGLDRPRLPEHRVGVQEADAWDVRGPPHKARYCVLRNAEPDEDNVDEDNTTRSARILRQLQSTLFPSAAFRAWLARASMLVPLGYAVEARRFRPGLDYTLATGCDTESRFDVVLGLTPDVSNKKSNRKGKGKAKAIAFGWDDGQWGGWQCYMAPHEGEEDPAVYRFGSGRKPNAAQDKAPKNDAAGDTELDSDADADGSVEEDEVFGSDEEDEEGGTLLTAQPSFNQLLLVLRDEGVMRFVKYVSANAPGSRWDVCGEYEVGMVQESEGE